MKTFAHKRPIRNEAGERIGEAPAPVSRATVALLGGQFGTDKSRRLVVTLKDGDIIEFRPERTQRPISIQAVDVYRFVLRCVAQRVSLEKARTRKAAIAARRERARIQAADRRLRNEIRRDRE